MASAFPPREAPIVNVAVLLLAAIGVVGACRSALGAVDAKVTLGPVDDTHGPPLDPLAGGTLDAARAIEWGDVGRVAGVGRILHVSRIRNILDITSIGPIRVRRGVLSAVDIRNVGPPGIRS